MLYLYSDDDWGEQVFKSTTRKKAREFIIPKLQEDRIEFKESNLITLTRKKLNNIYLNISKLK